MGEWYMVHDHVWEQAWAGRRKSWHCLPGQQILCIGCLEQRIGRSLMRCDFTDAPVNDPLDRTHSKRLRDRLTATEGHLRGEDGMLQWLAAGMIDKIPDHAARERAWAAFHRCVPGPAS
jgi:hypothetical protein